MGVYKKYTESTLQKEYKIYMVKEIHKEFLQKTYKRNPKQNQNSGNLAGQKIHVIFIFFCPIGFLLVLAKFSLSGID